MKEGCIMRRASVAARAGALAGVCAVGVPAAVAISSAASGAQAATSRSQAAASSRTVQVWMAGDQRAAQRFVDAASTPGSPRFRRFLSPGAYTRRFGPSAAQLKAVESYLTGAGFTRVRASVNDVYISAIAPASVGSEISFPASVSRDVLGVTGLNGAQPAAGDAAATPASSGASLKAPGCSRYFAQKTAKFSPAFDGLTKAAVPVCGYSAGQIRGAYGLAPADTGKGKTIALIEVGAPDDMFQTLTDYARANGLPAPRRGQYREEAVGPGGSNGACADAALEEAAMDSEAAYAMAPGARQLMVDGDDCDTSDNGAEALLDAMLVPLTGHGATASASIESVSWGLEIGTESSVPLALVKISNSIALRAAAEGVSLLNASGDQAGVEPPASDPDITAVGGTTLGVGARGQRVFETGWSTDLGERRGTSGPWYDGGFVGGTGGGVSSVYGEPGYQKGVVPDSMSRGTTGKPGRAVPDISADADPFTGLLFGLIVVEPNGKTIPYQTFRQAGTSTAAPLVAGMVADAEQGQRRNFGFLNPLLYSLAGSRAYHDILPVSSADPQVERGVYTTGDTYINGKYAPGYQVGVNDVQDPGGTGQETAPGYDTMTGLGTPNGSAFIEGLRSGK
jgi:subtilase family serine protease